MRKVAVIAAYHEETRLPQVLDSVLPHVDEIVVVDDGSMDRTAEVAARSNVWVLRHPLNRGQGAALRTGTEAALELGADVIIHLDADGQHDPAYISAVLEPICLGKADVVFGSRFLGVPIEGAPVSRRALHVAIRIFNRWVLGIPVTMTDPQTGCRAFSAESARALPFYQDRMAHASEILLRVTRSHWRWQEVPIRVIYSSETLKKGQKTTDAFKIVWQLVLGAFHR